jgi:hypothetical protein
MRLRPLQNAFAGYILQCAGEIRSAVRPGSKADTDTLLGVYRHGYSARLVEVLGNDFPALRALAGAEEFETLARDYIAAHPSLGFSVRTVGAALASFLAETPPYAARPALADMAAFEAAMADAFDAADAVPIGIGRMAALPPPAWPSLAFRFHPSVQHLSLRTDAPGFWAAWNADKAPTLPADRPGDWLVWRQGLDVKYRALAADESAALQGAMAGEDFSTLCEVLAEHGPEEEAAPRAAGLVRVWVESGLIMDVSDEGLLSG